MDIMCNPVFYRAGEYIETLEEAYKIDDNTRALLVVPVKEKKEWFAKLDSTNHWKLVATYLKGADMFTRAKM